jgi:hypothetical protein
MKRIIFSGIFLLLALMMRGQDKDWKLRPFSGSFDNRGITLGIEQGSHSFFRFGYEHCMGSWSRCAFGNGFMSTSLTGEYNPVQRVWGAGMGMMSGAAGMICFGLWGGIYEHSGKDAFLLPYFRPEFGIGGQRIHLAAGYNFLFGTYRFENITGVNGFVLSLRYFLPLCDKETSDL